MDAQDIASNIAFTTSGALVDCVDKKMLVMLRDGKKLIGVLRSYDQFGKLLSFPHHHGCSNHVPSSANLVLQDTVERVFVGNRYGDIARGVFLVRGENVVLMGEIVSLSIRSLLPADTHIVCTTQDLDAEDEVPPSIAAPLPQSALPQLFAAREAEAEHRAKSEARKADILRTTRGFCADKSGDGDLY